MDGRHRRHRRLRRHHPGRPVVAGDDAPLCAPARHRSRRRARPGPELAGVRDRPAAGVLTAPAGCCPPSPVATPMRRSASPPGSWRCSSASAEDPLDEWSGCRHQLHEGLTEQHLIEGWPRTTRCTAISPARAPDQLPSQPPRRRGAARRRRQRIPNLYLVPPRGPRALRPLARRRRTAGGGHQPADVPHRHRLGHHGPPGLCSLAAAIPAATRLVVVGTSRSARLAELLELFGTQLVVISQNPVQYARHGAVMGPSGPRRPPRHRRCRLRRHRALLRRTPRRPRPNAVTDVVHLGVVHVHDPESGWATSPVAAVAWTDQHVVAWSWLPRNEGARQLRADLDALDPLGLARWLNDHCEDPGIIHAVDLVEDLGRRPRRPSGRRCRRRPARRRHGQRPLMGASGSKTHEAFTVAPSTASSAVTGDDMAQAAPPRPSTRRPPPVTWPTSAGSPQRAPSRSCARRPPRRSPTGRRPRPCITPSVPGCTRRPTPSCTSSPRPPGSSTPRSCQRARLRTGSRSIA